MTKKRLNKVLAGVDGCPGGWIAVIERPGRDLVAQVFPSFTQLVDAIGGAARIGVDMPIGLPDRGYRACEREARQRLGVPRMSSVFSVPPRGCLAAGTYEEACAIRMKIEGKSMSRQTYGILAKIREVDRYLLKTPNVASRVAEMHPEVSFAAWHGGVPMAHNKRKAAGRAERRALIEQVWPGEIDRLRRVLIGERYALDDLHDAFAVLWSVRRWVEDKAEVLGDGARDAKGLPMRMVV